MSDQTEYTLLQQARDGERAAFEQLQASLERPARRFVRRLIGTSDAEDDIVQNAFFALYVNLERLDEGEKLRPFLFRVLRNQCYDELRRQGRYEMVSIDDDWGDGEDYAVVPVDQQPQPDETAHWLLLYSEVQQAINTLPELQRQTLLLYTEADLSYAEIAETMGTNIGTVKSRLYYAKKTLVNLLSPETLAALELQNEGETTDDGE